MFQLIIIFDINKGNNIPQDILKAVSVATKQNADRQILDEEHRNRTEMMAKELEKAENLKMKEVDFKMRQTLCCIISISFFMIKLQTRIHFFSHGIFLCYLVLIILTHRCLVFVVS